MITPLTCLTMAIYLEAGNQPLEGKVAVAQVVMNRAKHTPDNICDVVKEPYQFSFYWDGKPETVPTLNKLEIQAYKESEGVASAFLAEGGDGSHIDDMTKGAEHYHATYVSPCWTNREGSVKIGDHLFITELGEC